MNKNDYCKNEKQLATLKQVADSKWIQRKVSSIVRKLPGSGPERAFVFKFGANYDPKKPMTAEELLVENKEEISQIIGGKCLKVEIPQKQKRFVHIFNAAKKKSPKSPRACEIIKYFCAKPEETAKIVHETINQPEPDPFL